MTEREEEHAATEQHVARIESEIEEQRRIIQELETHGQDPSDARSFLAALSRSLEIMRGKLRVTESSTDSR